MGSKTIRCDYRGAEFRVGLLLYPESVVRPRVRAECPAERPCPFVGCRYNLALDIGPGGNLRLTAGTGGCALDFAGAPQSLKQIAERLGITEQRVAQIVTVALGKLRNGMLSQ